MIDASILQRIAIDASDASGLVVLDADHIVLVDDERGVCCVNAQGRVRWLLSRADWKDLRDLEGICFDGARDRLLVLSEKTGRVHATAISWMDADLVVHRPEEVGRLERIGKVPNKGWEGISYIPPGKVARGDALVAVHEGKPRRVGLFQLPGLERIALIKLPKSMKGSLDDLSDVAYVAERDRLLLLSDESRTIVEARLVERKGAWTLELVKALRVDVGSKREKPEGLCLGPAGSLWLVTDGDAHLYELSW